MVEIGFSETVSCFGIRKHCLLAKILRINTTENLPSAEARNFSLVSHVQSYCFTNKKLTRWEEKIDLG